KDLYRSRDSGRSFNALGTVEESHALGFGRARTGQSYPSLYLIGKVNGVAGFFRSDDVGKTWVRINDDKHQFGFAGIISGDPRLFGRVYVGTGGRGVLYGDPAK
ncbi:MAG TPA: xyloglucanase, partial [Polyangiaceae bacterium]|nr:xyloglucanase [Polyangiaceae bacterium]